MTKLVNNSLSGFSFLLIGHYATFAEADMLFDYLIDHKAKRITKIQQPLPELPYLKKTEVSVYEDGVLKESRSIFSFIRPIWFAYIYEAMLLLIIVFGSKRSYDVIIAQDSLVAFLGIILRTFGKSKKVIFYSHGIDKQRFGNVIFNYLYQMLDTISAKGSDFCWFMSKKMIPIRHRQKISEDRLFWIPSTLPIKLIKRKKTGKKNNIVFLGTIDKKNGAMLLPEIIAKVKKDISDVKLDIMGNGEFFSPLKASINKLNLEKHISLLGHVSFPEFSAKLTDYIIGLAPYEYSENNLTPLSDSLKMRAYLAAGLAVVITKGFWFSDEIAENQLGFAVKARVDDFAKAIVAILKDHKRSQEIRERALSYSKKLDLTAFYDRAFDKVFSSF